ncbi:MAG: hypothetical protein HUU37_07590 [Bdellovibrionales bacterium]|nr:hypothetical protein [Bdellovibrionales bacterium]
MKQIVLAVVILALTGCESQVSTTVKPFQADLKLEFHPEIPVEILKDTFRASVICSGRVSRGGEGFIDYKSQVIDATMVYTQDAQGRGHLGIRSPKKTDVDLDVKGVLLGCSLEVKVDVLFPTSGNNTAVLSLSVPANGPDADVALLFQKTFDGMELTSRIIPAGQRADGAATYCTTAVVGTVPGGEEVTLANSNTYPCKIY